MSESDTPETDAKEKETERRPIREHAHYGWKTARKFERRLREADALQKDNLQEQEYLRQELSAEREAHAKLKDSFNLLIDRNVAHNNRIAELEEALDSAAKACEAHHNGVKSSES